MNNETFEKLESLKGQKLILFGMQGEIKTRAYWAIYPYRHFVMDAWFQPDESEAYREQKSKMGDDWSICFKDNPDSLTYVMNQIESINVTA